MKKVNNWTCDELAELISTYFDDALYSQGLEDLIHTLSLKNRANILSLYQEAQDSFVIELEGGKKFIVHITEEDK